MCQDSSTPRVVKIMRHPQLLTGSADSSVGEKSNLKIYFLGVFGLIPLMNRGNSHCGKVGVCPFVLNSY